MQIINLLSPAQEHWKYDPFSGHKDDNGDIYGRGTQDMKCVGVQYLEALKSLRKDGHKFLRTIYISFVPDEEIGGLNGMKKFVRSDAFQKMNVGFALDEGYANPTDNFYVFYGERTVLWVKVKCPGQPGHGSQFLTNTAGKTLQKVIDSFLGYRDEQERLLKENKNLRLGDVNTVNLTMLEGGVQYNVVPAELSVGFDIRVTPSQDLTEFEQKITSLCKAAGDDVTYEFVVNKIPEPSERQKQLTCVEDGQNPWWDAFSQACEDEGINLDKQIFPGGTDSKFLRQVNIPALGFSPMNRTPILLHDHNEFLNEKVFLRGIEIYKTIISALANMKV
nr:aminoacylase-1B-like isoform X1 [Cherax quadricarinatus]